MDTSATVRDAVLLEMALSRGYITPDIRHSLESLDQKSWCAETLIASLVSESTISQAEGEALIREADRIATAATLDLAPVGCQIDDFRIIREIGRGGMGIVYEAEQESLGRRVALKLLSEAGSHDTIRVLRFVREAHVLGRLHHPGIVPVYAWGAKGSLLYFAMELIEGGSLKDLLDNGPLEAMRAARLAKDVADALGHAHNAGLVHRDIKPENILITLEERARVTDFGIAYDERGETLTVSHAVLGTPAFIAPEQALGDSATPANDIYGLGAVIYTMLAGRPPYLGDSAKILLKVLVQDPPRLHSLNRALPRELAAICERAMERDPSHRYPTVNAMAIDLERFLEGRTPAASGLASGVRAAFRRVRRRSRSVVTWLAIAAALAAGSGILWIAATKPPKPTGDASSPWHSPRQFTSLHGRESSPSLSPDGDTVVFASGASGNWDIYKQHLGEDAINLSSVHDGLDHQPALSPDGRQIAFVSDRDGPGIFLMPQGGTPVRRVTSFGGNPAWSADGKMLVFGSRGVYGPHRPPKEQDLWIVEIESGELRQLGLQDAAMPHWSSQGHRIAYQSFVGGQADIWTVNVDGTDPVRLTSHRAKDWGPAWAPAGDFIYFSSDRGADATNIWRIEVDEITGRPQGEAQPVTQELAVSSYGPRLSADGHRLAFTRWDPFEVAIRIPFDPRTIRVPGRSQPITRDSRLSRYPSPSPKLEHFVYSKGDVSNQLAIRDPDGTDRSMNFPGTGRRFFPRWSPDGRTIALQATKGSSRQIWTFSPEGDTWQQWTSGPAQASYPVWSPDSSTLAFTVESTTGNGQHGRLLHLTQESGKRFSDLPPLPDGSGSFSPSSWSTDGKEIAGQSDGHIVVFSLEDRRYRQLCEFGGWPQWLPDDSGLLFSWQGKLWVVSRYGGEAHIVYEETRDKLSPWFDLSGDGRWIYTTRMSMRGDIWTLDRSSITNTNHATQQ